MIIIPPMEGAVRQAGVWQLNMREQQRDLAAMFSDLKPAKMRVAVKAITEQYATEYAHRVKKIIAAESSDTGRLAASYGPYEKQWLHRGYKASLASIGEHMPHGRYTGTEWDKESDESDSIFYPETHGNVYYYIVGSNVPYAVPVMLGFTSVAGNRVYVPRYGAWITVPQFTFAGIHADERAMAELDSDPGILDAIADPMINEALAF